MAFSIRITRSIRKSVLRNASTLKTYQAGLADGTNNGVSCFRIVTTMWEVLVINGKPLLENKKAELKWALCSIFAFLWIVIVDASTEVRADSPI